MGYTGLIIDVSPNATAYDENHPTRSTELLNHQLHEMLVDMEDATGTWWLQDTVPDSTARTTTYNKLYDQIEAVFNYAEGAIDTYRDTGTPLLSKPTIATVPVPPTTMIYSEYRDVMWRNYKECLKICFFVYYMWKTEEDPLLVVEKIREILEAWPLLDTTIELQNDMGQSFKVYPSWKNADLDL